jgi:hypothetical protein
VQAGISGGRDHALACLLAAPQSISAGYLSMVSIRYRSWSCVICADAVQCLNVLTPFQCLRNFGCAAGAIRDSGR